MSGIVSTLRSILEACENWSVSVFDAYVLGTSEFYDVRRSSAAYRAVFGGYLPAPKHPASDILPKVIFHE